MDFPRTQRKPITVSLVPMIDVSIFLLIFFMLAGTVEKFEIIPVTPPVAQSGKLVDEGHIVILLGAHAEIIMNDEIVPIEKMQAQLAPELKSNPHKVVTVKADATVPANRAIEVMDAIKAAGGKNLSLMTQKAGGNGQ